MKLVIVSDIHGSVLAAMRAVKEMEREGADYLISLGDVMYHGPRNPLPEDYNPAEVARVLNSVADRVIAVRGNCDSEVDQMLLDFPMMADYQVLPFDGFKFFMTHGHLFAPDSLPAGLASGDIFAFGHVHIPMFEENNGILIFNPGSAALSKDGHPETYAVMDEKKIQIKTFDGDVYMERKI